MASFTFLSYCSNRDTSVLSFKALAATTGSSEGTFIFFPVARRFWYFSILLRFAPILFIILFISILFVTLMLTPPRHYLYSKPVNKQIVYFSHCIYHSGSCCICVLMSYHICHFFIQRYS